MSSGNDAIAGHLLGRADDAMRLRKTLLVARVAVQTTSDLASARAVLAQWDGPADIRDGALAVLAELAARVPRSRTSRIPDTQTSAHPSAANETRGP